MAKRKVMTKKGVKKPAPNRIKKIKERIRTRLA